MEYFDWSDYPNGVITAECKILIYTPEERTRLNEYDKLYNQGYRLEDKEKFIEHGII